jgi:2-polyprenyl-3-methyl-5-hydroxy-6-metoxy-1,4-benzoquinol methylase
MRKKVFIGIPCFDMVPPEVLEDYMRFAYYLGRRYREYDFYLGIRTKSEQFRARNDLVKAALDVAADYLFMIDDDHIIDFDETQWATNRYEFLKKLIGHIENNPKIGLVGALYFERGNECRPVLMRKITPVNYEWYTDKDVLGRLQPVDVQGGGVMLLNMKVFDLIQGPDWFAPEHVYGTDIQICRKIQEVGFGVYSDTSIEIGHLRSQRMVVTNKTRAKVVNSEKDKEDKAKIICNYGRMVMQYRNDIMEYLGIDEQIASDMYTKYDEYWHDQFDKMPIREWYIASSRDFLGRQIIANNPERIPSLYPLIFDSFYSGVTYKCLDFGCGSSILGFELAKMGHELIFCDIPETETFKFLQWRCKKYNIIARFIDNLEEIRGESFDCIMALDVVEHFKEEEVKELIEKYQILLAPQGMLLCNFMVNLAFDFSEHIFMDKPKFMQIIAENGLFPLNYYTYIKASQYYGATQ